MEMHFSPLDTRYKENLPEVLSEESLMKYQVEVEKRWLLTLVSEGLCPKVNERDLDRAFEGLSFEEVSEIESRTQHATRALVEALVARLEKKKLSKVAHWVHVGLTSFDTVDTAYRLRLKDFIDGAFRLELDRLQAEFKRIAKTYSKIPTVGRTHGQWAVPSLFGLPFAEAALRIKRLDTALKNSVAELCGQASGAVGAYQAGALLFKDPIRVEEKFLKSIGLKRHFGSTQIIPPEDIYNVASDLFAMGSVIAKVAHDLRHQARSEIAEVAEGLKKGQVGSSTMPQKRNPWNLEHVCSLFKVLQSRFNLIEIDLISEHQRDLTNSASGRFQGEFFSVIYLMILRLRKVLENLEVVEDSIKKHFDSAGDSVFAEAFYVLGTKKGVSDAHDKVREASRSIPVKNKSQTPLLDAVKTQGLVEKSLSLKSLQEQTLRGAELKLAAIFRELDTTVI